MAGKTLIASAFAVLALASPAWAQGPAEDEYTEHVPEADGGGGGAGGGAELPEDTANELEGFGDDGVALEELAESTAPAAGEADEPDGSKGGDKPKPDEDRSEDVAGAAGGGDGSGPGSGASSTVEPSLSSAESDDGGGAGLLVPVVMLLALLGALIYGLARRRVSEGTAAAR